MAIDHIPVPFDRHHPEKVISHMADLAARRDGRGWISFQPKVDPEAEISDGTFAIFSARGPLLPNATWVPAHRRRRKSVPTMAGLEHPAGKDAVAQLRAAGIVVPDGWTLQQDHPRRGLTFVVPDGDAERVAVDFLTTAGALLTPLDVGDDWFALVSVQR